MSVDEPVHLPPPVLYKYCPPERIDILCNVAVRFTPPEEFNDTFDTQHIVTGSVQERIKRIKFRGAKGIFCLTETADDHLMWVHYARNHTGFVLGFDAQAEFFREDGRRLAPVCYTEPSNIPVPSTPELAESDLPFFKAPAWRNEREWRCVKQFARQDSRFVDFEPKLIREIIIGHKTESSLISQLVNLVDAFEMTKLVQFYLSTPSPTQWRFLNVPITYSYCKHCCGQGYAAART
jgi:hypothetical protein